MPLRSPIHSSAYLANPTDRNTTPFSQQPTQTARNVAFQPATDGRCARLILLNFLPPLMHQRLELIGDLRVIVTQVFGFARVLAEVREKYRVVSGQRLVSILGPVVGDTVQY